MRNLPLICGVGVALLTLSGCGGGSGSDSASVASSPGTSAATASNSAPTISGQPTTSVTAGSSYSFTPTASDANGDALQFSATNLPSWAALNQQTGAITGTPPSGSVGTTGSIVISVSDGSATASLAPFTISVKAAVAQGTAKVSWVAPTTNADGTPLTNLAGFTIHYGNAAASLTQTVQVSNAGAASYVLSNLSSGTWYFAVSAYTSSGAESDLSAVASKTI